MPATAAFRLVSRERRARLQDLRAGVEPIYKNRLHRHFTDHSIEHCDRVGSLAEKLLAPLKKKLSDDEGSILYGGAYLHDIGMHNEAAGQTRRLAARLKQSRQDWAKIDFESRLDLIRKYHHEISADMVFSSVRSGTPLIGFTLDDKDMPGEVAAICEAHCVDTAAPRYEELIAKPERPTMRLRLLAAILRLADVLDEAHHRALVNQARVLELPLESKMHWWRHYYTREVEVDPVKNRITIVFEFPPGKRDNYAKVVPSLQVPWVEQEFARHRAALAEQGLNWHLASVIPERPFETLDQMPPDVEALMLQELARRKQFAAQQSRIDLLAHFDVSRTHLVEQLRAVEAKRASTDPADYLRDVLRLTRDLWELGSHTTARAQLRSAMFFATTNGRSVDPQLHVRAATDLSRMHGDDDPRSSVAALTNVEKTAEAMPDSAPEKVQFYKLLASVALRAGAFSQGSAAALAAMNLLGKDPAAEAIKAEMAEATFIEGQNVPNRLAPKRK